MSDAIVILTTLFIMLTSICRPLRFKMIDFLAGNDSIIINVTFNWSEPSILIKEHMFLSNTDHNGDPWVVQGSKEVRLSEAVK